MSSALLFFLVLSHFPISLSKPCTILRPPSWHRRLARAAKENPVYTQPPRQFSAKNLWTDGVVHFRFQAGYSSRSLVEEAMGKIQRHTCIRFVSVPANYSLPHIHITNGSNCASFVGKQPAVRAQELSLPNWCLRRKDGILHELLHVLGFGHEQTRLDRGNFVDVNWSNLSPRYWFAFQEDLDGHIRIGYSVPYDYSSILHYGPYDFAKRKRTPTLTSRNPHFHVRLNEDISFLDMVKVNLLYNCSSQLEQMSKSCLDYVVGCREILPEDCSNSDYIAAVCPRSCQLCHDV